jgi:hypothetical protein
VVDHHKIPDEEPVDWPMTRIEEEPEPVHGQGPAPQEESLVPEALDALRGS